MGKPTIHGHGELDFIEQIRVGQPVRTGGVILGIGDDCAILSVPRGNEVLVTTDFTLEGKHFRRDWHPAQCVGHKALARGLSDLAAMGARPLAAFLSLALPAEMRATKAGRIWAGKFMRGLGKLAAEFGIPLAGGDTSESPCGLVLADIVLVGSAPAGRALRRSGGRPGDVLYVTGALGGAAAELATMMANGATNSRSQVLRGSAEDHPQLLPRPRVNVGLSLLRRKLASAAIDLSDGLSTDLAHLCRESNVGAEIDARLLPIHALALQAGSEQALNWALNGGEDYELLFSAPAAVRMPRTIADVPIRRIGTLKRIKRVVLIGAAGQKRLLEPRGWEHFRK